MSAVDDERVRVELPVPPEDRVTLSGETEAISPERETDVERATFPEKPFRLTS